MAKYLDLAGLTTFWGKVKKWVEDRLAGKADTAHTHSNYASTAVATQSANGLMSKEDKQKLDKAVISSSGIKDIKVVTDTIPTTSDNILYLKFEN